MKLKTKLLKHPSGIEIETPIFVPSYSSKGFALEKKQNGKYKSEVCQAIAIAKEMLVESQLVSAYDLYYDYLLKPKDFISTKITFIDSGGYETSGSFDFSETKRGNHQHEVWQIEYLNEVLKDWQSERFPAVIVNFDNEKIRKSFLNQINDAESFFKQYHGYLYDFLIKPDSPTKKLIDIDKLIKCINKLKPFDIIGVTEKELGSSILERMQKIYKLRLALDKSKNHSPIHIFGSLDPISVILYFLAGAEIFDGLTWLKYSYHEGIAMYTNNLCAMDRNIQISTTDSQVKARSITNNIYYLEKLKNILIEFTKTDEFEKFEELGEGIGEIIKQNYNIFKNRLKK